MTVQTHVRRALAAVLASAVLASGQHAGASVAPPGTPVDKGPVAVVLPTDVDTTVDSGGSGAPFALRLPDGSTCPGDSANDNWRVDSFMVPSSVDPATLEFN